MHEFLSVCEEAARTGGEVLLKWRDRFTTREKGFRDLVTEADVAAQEAIRKVLLGRFPEHDFLGEEDDALRTFEPSRTSSGTKPEFRWIVDPLDGTANYVHRLQTFAVSIALEQAGQVIVGGILDPIAGEFYSAIRGQGAYLNGQKIRVSGCEVVGQAMTAISFAPNVDRDSIEVARFIEALVSCQSVRRLGSAALNLAYLAAGRLDAYFASSVKIWDIAAGILLVQEAGGVVTAIDGSPLDISQPEFLASASPPLQFQMLDVLARAAKERPA